MLTGCLFCGGDASEPNHLAHCDGRQGGIEETLPRLISGLAPETWQTSASAAMSIEETKETQRERVFEQIHRAGRAGRTDDELQAALGLDGSSERPRRWELWKLDRIAILRGPDGQAIRRMTRTQRRAVVWIDRRFAQAVAS
jgi:hypothetical protein